MIIGKGDIASSLTDQPDKIFFASGVSDSSCTDREQFQREKDLLLKQNRFSHLVYFSTLSIYYSDTPYTRHKRTIEHLVKDNFCVSTIMRLGNITWGTNPHTLINFLRNKIKNNESYDVQDVYRYIISKNEFQHWIGMIPQWNTEMNITGRRMKVKEIAYIIKQDNVNEFSIKMGNEEKIHSY